jgi:hypothetical protein
MGELAKNCQIGEKQDFKDPNDAMSAGICIGSMSGALIMAQVEKSRSASSPPAPGLCIPYGVSSGQLIKVFLKYADDNPDLLHEPLSVAVENLYRSFPCCIETSKNPCVRQPFLLEDPYRLPRAGQAPRRALGSAPEGTVRSAGRALVCVSAPRGASLVPFLANALAVPVLEGDVGEHETA